MVGGEEGGVIVEYGFDGGVSPEFRIQKLPDCSPVPAAGMPKVDIEREVPFVKSGCLKVSSLRAVDREVEDGDVHKLDFLGVINYEIEGMLRLHTRLCWCAEEEIAIGGDASLF